VSTNPDILELLADTLDGVYAVDLNQRIVLWNGGLIAAEPPVQVPTELKGDEENDVLKSLTAREREVLRHLARGRGTKGIAEALVVSTATLRNHIQRILPKLGAHNRLEAVTAASRFRLL